MNSKSTSIKVNALSNVTVLLLGSYIPAPLAASLLSDMGARVIKIEPPQGDRFREWKSNDKSEAPCFSAYNRGFKSIIVNLKEDEGVEIFKKIVKTVDIVLDGNRSGFIESFIKSKIETINPLAVYIPITAFGIIGIQSPLAGHDMNILAKIGLFN